jgi:hypothetical protein
VTTLPKKRSSRQLRSDKLRLDNRRHVIQSLVTPLDLQPGPEFRHICHHFRSVIYWVSNKRVERLALQLLGSQADVLTTDRRKGVYEDVLEVGFQRDRAMEESLQRREVMHAY